MQKHPEAPLLKRQLKHVVHRPFNVLGVLCRAFLASLAATRAHQVIEEVAVLWRVGQLEGIQARRLSAGQPEVRPPHGFDKAAHRAVLVHCKQLVVQPAQEGQERGLQRRFTGTSRAQNDRVASSLFAP